MEGGRTGHGARLAAVVVVLGTAISVRGLVRHAVGTRDLSDIEVVAGWVALIPAVPLLVMGVRRRILWVGMVASIALGIPALAAAAMAVEHPVHNYMGCGSVLRPVGEPYTDAEIASCDGALDGRRTLVALLAVPALGGLIATIAVRLARPEPAALANGE